MTAFVICVGSSLLSKTADVTQSHAATADTSQLSSLSLSELSVDASGPPMVLQGPYVP